MVNSLQRFVELLLKRCKTVRIYVIPKYEHQHTLSIPHQQLIFVELVDLLLF
jgi:hypothetical protein